MIIIIIIYQYIYVNVYFWLRLRLLFIRYIYIDIATPTLRALQMEQARGLQIHLKSLQAIRACLSALAYASRLAVAVLYGWTNPYETAATASGCATAATWWWCRCQRKTPLLLWKASPTQGSYWHCQYQSPRSSKCHLHLSCQGQRCFLASCLWAV